MLGPSSFSWGFEEKELRKLRREIVDAMSVIPTIAPYKLNRLKSAHRLPTQVE